MLKNLKKHVIAGAILVSGLLGASGLAGAQDYLRTFTLINRSNFTIRQIYVSPTSFDNWGYDRLGRNVLRPDFRVTLDLEPGYYDLKLVDEDGDACVVGNVDFRHNDYLVLNNVNLLACEFLH